MNRFEGTCEDLPGWLDDHQVEETRIVWSDLAGLARGKIVPGKSFANAATAGVGFTAAAMSFDCLSIPVAQSGIGAEQGYFNVKAMPDLATLRLAPHLPRTALCIADPVEANGQISPQSPRAFAKRVSSDLAHLGFVCQAAPELEAYLLGPDGQLLEAGMPCYGAETLGRFTEPLRRVIDATAAFAEIEAWHHEHGPGQFEINIAPQGLLEAADALFLLRTASREAAALAGARMSWMAKPFSGLNGSACQINLSLWSADGATNLLADPDDPLRLTVLARQFIAGLLEHLDELAAILLPNANSYRRVVPGHFAPLAKAWGVDNRTAALRVVTDTPKTTRIEVRVGGADICAHLALPALVAAGLDGIRRSLDPGAPASGNLEARDSVRLIDDWRAALERFERSAWAMDVLSPELHRLYAQVKRQEYERWRRHVSDFDRSEYFGIF